MPSAGRHFRAEIFRGSQDTLIRAESVPIARSLSVGGVGIRNIMLASLTGRTREIGIRRALGATRKHIAAQFLVEITTLTCVGGLLGVAAGLAIAGVLGGYAAHYAGIEPPVVLLLPVAVAFGFAVGVGIVFACTPRCGPPSKTRSWRCATTSSGHRCSMVGSIPSGLAN